ncbi:putative glutamate--tRNA ligase, mitochondrial [Halotydeus destructor]|nr:putative glutamate--tRNA ligase, mitochondrial [Halotydeus destructor]
MRINLASTLCRLAVRRLYSTDRAVRVRFAPSPTGFLHLGSIRTALYNCLYARKHGGKFVVRIEDTDQERTVPGALEAIEEILNWSGLRPDESPSVGGEYGPYIQSQRSELYKDKADELLKSGHAYRCFCSSVRLDLLRKESLKNREIPRYDRKCRNLTAEELQEKLDRGDKFTIRLKLKEGEITFQDEVYGQISLDLSATESDPIIYKSDGFPTYHLANVVDDHYMKISHVLRGVEWQTSTPKHLMIYEAFGWQPPNYAHLPLIVNSDGTKLSKRQDDIRVEALKKEGYFPETILNYLKNVGGGFGRQEIDEILLLDELAEQFSLNKVNTNSGRLDPKKFKLYNRLALIERISNDKPGLVKLLRKEIKTAFGEDVEESYDDAFYENILIWSQERIHFLVELTKEYGFVWRCPDFSWDTGKYSKLGDLESLLAETICLMDDVSEVDSVLVSKGETFRQFCAERKISYGKYMQFLRVAITNETNGPPIGDILYILGHQRFKEYLESSLNYVRSKKSTMKSKETV